MILSFYDVVWATDKVAQHHKNALEITISYAVSQVIACQEHSHIKFCIHFWSSYHCYKVNPAFTLIRTVTDLLKFQGL